MVFNFFFSHEETINVENSIDYLVDGPFSDPYQISSKPQWDQNRSNSIKCFRINESDALTIIIKTEIHLFGFLGITSSN